MSKFRNLFPGWGAALLLVVPAAMSVSPSTYELGSEAATGYRHSAALAVWGHGAAMLSMDAAARFVVHPARCAQLLGHAHHEDGLSPAFHADLEAALDATGLSPERAIGQIGSRCWQRLGQ